VNLLFALAALGNIDGLRREFPGVARDHPNPALAARQNALWVWRELRAHGHQAAAASWLADLLRQPRPNPTDTSLAGILIEGDIQYAAERWEAARRVYAVGLAQHSRNPTLLGRLGTTAAHLGDLKEAQRLDRTLARLPTPYLFGSHTYARARIAAALGDRTTAVELLRRAWAQGRPLAFDNWGEEDVHIDKDFDSLRAYLPFQALMWTD
jgi:hypothetical protein